MKQDVVPAKEDQIGAPLFFFVRASQWLWSTYLQSPYSLHDSIGEGDFPSLKINQKSHCIWAAGWFPSVQIGRKSSQFPWYIAALGTRGVNRKKSETLRLQWTSDQSSNRQITQCYHQWVWLVKVDPSEPLTGTLEEEDRNINLIFLCWDNILLHIWLRDWEKISLWDDIPDHLLEDQRKTQELILTWFLGWVLALACLERASPREGGCWGVMTPSGSYPSSSIS